MSVFRPKGRKTYCYEFIDTRHSDKKDGREKKGGFKTRREAADAEAKRRDELKNGGAVPKAGGGQSVRFTDWAGQFLLDKGRELERKGRTPEVIERRQKNRKKDLRIVLRFFGSKPEQEESRKDRNPANIDLRPYHDLTLLDPIVEPAWITKFEAHMEARKLRGGTKNNQRSLMSQLYRHAMKPKYRELTGVTTNPFSGIDRDTAPRRVKVATPAELDRVIDNALPHLRLALFIGIYAFELRIGTILALRWDDIDPDFSLITVKDHKTAGTQLVDQVVPICRPLRAILKEAHKHRNPDCPFVVQYAGRGITTVQKSVKSACIAAGVPHGLHRGITFHTLRHTMGTEMARLGMPARTRQLLMNHESPRTTELYTRLMATDKKDALEQVGRHITRLLKKSHPKSHPGSRKFVISPMTHA